MLVAQLVQSSAQNTFYKPKQRDLTFDGTFLVDIHIHTYRQFRVAN